MEIMKLRNIANLLNLRGALLLLTIFSVVSCGYFSDDPIEDAQTYRNESLSNTCQIDPDQLSLILEEDVSEQLKCLESNLESFSRYVRSESRLYITQNELGNFVSRFFKKHAAMILDSMGLIFEVNMLFLNDHEERISRENIKPLFELLIVANKEAIKINNILKDMEKPDASIEELGARLRDSLRRISEKFVPIIQNKYGNQRSFKEVNIRDFVAKIQNQFSAFSLDDRTIDALLNLKKIFIGGKRHILTSDELLAFLGKGPELTGLAFDLYFATEKNIGGKKNLYKFYQDRLGVVSTLMHNHQDSEVLFSEEEAISLASYFLEDEKQENFTIDLIKETKKRLIDGRGLYTKYYNYKNIKTLLSFAQILSEGMLFLEDFRELHEKAKGASREELLELKNAFILTSTFRSQNLEKITKNESLYSPFMEVLDFAHFLNGKVDDINFDKDLLNSLFKIKKLMVGGEADLLNIVELRSLIAKVPTFSDFFFEFKYFNSESLSSLELNKLFLDLIRKGKRLLFTNAFHPVLETKDLIILGNWVQDIIELNGMEATFEVFKQKIIGGYDSIYTVGDVEKLLTLGEEFFGSQYFDYLNYELYNKEMSSSKAIGYLPYRHRKEFKAFDKTTLIKYRKEFNRVAKKYRFFRDSNGVQFFGNTIKRNKNGFVEVKMILWLFRKLAKVFGHKDPNADRHVLSLKEVETALVAFKPVLAKYGLWSKHFDTFARNCLLLADLFQYQSDGDMNMNADEAAEYGVLALSAIKLANDMLDRLEKYCPNVGFEGGKGYMRACYRPHFMRILIKEFGLEDKFVKLNQYVNSAPRSEIDNFHFSVEGFARDFDDPKVPLGKRDLTLLIGAMLNIESTFIRYDKNKNNILDPKEIDFSFSVYKEAIISVAKLEESQVKYSKSIYLYMIKEMEIPSKFDLVNFHYNPFISHDISGKRLNIGVLLYYLVNQ